MGEGRQRRTGLCAAPTSRLRAEIPHDNFLPPCAATRPSTTMHSTRLVVPLLLCVAARLPAQSTPAPITSPRSGIDLFLGAGLIRLSGEPGFKGKPGTSIGGVAFERPFRQRYSWRAELAAQPVMADMGPTGFFALPTTLSIYRFGIAGVARRYGARGKYVGLGVSVATVYGCDVDVEGGPGFLGGETISCADFTDVAISPASSLTSGIISAGIERERLGLELRYDVGLQPLFETTNGGVRPSALSLVLHYRFGRAFSGRPSTSNRTFGSITNPSGSRSAANVNRPDVAVSSARSTRTRPPASVMPISTGNWNGSPD